MEETPLLERRITYLPLLNAANRPAINQGDVFMNEDLFTTNGAGRRQTWFEVDGATGNDSWGRQTIFTNMPLDGRAGDDRARPTRSPPNTAAAPAASSTSSPKSAATSCTASVWNCGALRPPKRRSPASRAANAASGNDITSDTLGQSALSISGPVGSKHTHFFAGRRIQPRGSRFADHFAGGARQLSSGHYRGWLGFLRLDHQINDKQQSVLPQRCWMVFTTPIPTASWAATACPAVARVFHRRTYSEELGETAVLSPTLVNNVRVQFQLASPITEFDPGDLRHAVRGADLDGRHVHHRHFAIGAADEPPVSGQRHAVGGVGQTSGEVRRAT